MVLERAQKSDLILQETRRNIYSVAIRQAVFDREEENEKVIKRRKRSRKGERVNTRMFPKLEQTVSSWRYSPLSCSSNRSPVGSKRRPRHTFSRNPGTDPSTTPPLTRCVRDYEPDQREEEMEE